jgi:hypothetical protein
LSSLLVGDHFVLKANQNLLQVVLRVPLFEHVELGWLNNSVRLVDTWQVDFGVEFDCWRNIWVLVTALDFHHVDSVIEVGVLWADDGTIPAAERLIVT